MRSTSAAWTAATVTSPYDRAARPSTTMPIALILFRGHGGPGRRRADAKFRPGLREQITIQGVTGTPACSFWDRAARGKDGVRGESRRGPAGPCRRGRVDDSHAARRHAFGHRLHHDGGSG